MPTHFRQPKSSSEQHRMLPAYAPLPVASPPVPVKRLRGNAGPEMKLEANLGAYLPKPGHGAVRKRLGVEHQLQVRAKQACAKSSKKGLQNRCLYALKMG
jgi:hypothetical protein